MRKIIATISLSVDGYFCGPNGEIDWFVLDKEFDDHSLEVLDTVDTFLFGRTTYEGMANYWPTQGDKYNPEVAKRMNGYAKIAVSDKPIDLSWNNSQQLQGDLIEEVTKLKQQEGANICIYGSGDIVRQLTDAGLIDEYNLLIDPVILGDGKTLFKGVKHRTALNLNEVRQFKSGVVLHNYTLQK
ncbi:MAG TPA: dihydrofolate reductase family protein [Candidatus Saccharimonadales bacterium]|nr:dihydrofolate reductase family protein [Candidatus Saccharimonadales bacterium]